jgi:Transposase IS4
MCIALSKMSQFDENEINKEMNDYINSNSESDGGLEFDSEYSSEISIKSEYIISGTETDDDVSVINIKKAKLEGFKWADEPNKPEKFDFIGRKGLNPEIINSLCESPSENDMFKIFVDDMFWENIAQQTNVYAIQYMNKVGSSFISKSWTETNQYEIKAYFALCILMSQMKKHNLKLYWSTRKIIETPIFGYIMRRKRFLQI